MMASWIPGSAQDLIRALLQRNVRKRLGYKDDVEEIKQHKWFKGVDWHKVYNKEIEPVYQPEIDDEDDLGDMTNVADKYKMEDVRNTVVAKPSLNEQAYFKGFTYRGTQEDEMKDMFGRDSISVHLRDLTGIHENDDQKGKKKERIESNSSCE